MTKENFGTDCKVCLKPYTTFRWCPATGMKFRRTVICGTCSKLKNICQSCMLDLKYGLPVQVRDKVLGIQEQVPKNEANREYFIASNAARLARGDTSLIDYDKSVDPKAKAVLEKLATKRQRNDDRNLPPPCSFYAKGRCNRGDLCPYRHVLVAERYPSLQSYRDRYYGENDPAAERIIERNQSLLQTAPAIRDTNIRTLFLKGLDPDCSEDVIRKYFKDTSSITALRLFPDNSSALVQFSSQQDADNILSESNGSLDLNDHVVTVVWADSNIRNSESSNSPERVVKRQRES